jgi:hypothetical protein
VECKLGNITHVYQTAPWKFVDALSFSCFKTQRFHPDSDRVHGPVTFSAHSQRLAYFPFSHSRPLIFGLESGGRQVFPFDNGARHTNFLFGRFIRSRLSIPDAQSRHRLSPHPSSSFSLGPSNLICWTFNRVHGPYQQLFVSCFFRVYPTISLSGRFLFVPRVTLRQCALPRHVPAILMPPSMRAAPLLWIKGDVRGCCLARPIESLYGQTVELLQG